MALVLADQIERPSELLVFLRLLADGGYTDGAVVAQSYIFTIISSWCGCAYLKKRRCGDR